MDKSSQFGWCLKLLNRWQFVLFLLRFFIVYLHKNQLDCLLYFFFLDVFIKLSFYYKLRYWNLNSCSHSIALKKNSNFGENVSLHLYEFIDQTGKLWLNFTVLWLIKLSPSPPPLMQKNYIYACIILYNRNLKMFQLHRLDLYATVKSSFINYCHYCKGFFFLVYQPAWKCSKWTKKK